MIVKNVFVEILLQSIECLKMVIYLYKCYGFIKSLNWGFKNISENGGKGVIH